jgi:hypothetical protein
VWHPTRQIAVIAGVLLTAAACVALLAMRAHDRVFEAGFWFDEVSYRSSSLGVGLSPRDLETIDAVARAELAEAYAGLRLRFSVARDAPYRVRVVQDARDPRFRGNVGVAGQSRTLMGVRGDGVVNFGLIASYADAYAPPDATRDAIVAAIGRGVGRAAVHEFAHQLLGNVRLHDTNDSASYEYGSADRREQYYGEMHWGIARPLLQRRFGAPGR